MRSSFRNIPLDFIFRRLHSIAGLGLVIFIMSHLITNSQAALLIGQDGQGFIKSVNAIHSIPFLTVVEICALAIPILIHLAWGIKYLKTAQSNSFNSDGTTPHLASYPRNKAYTWQRITSYILAFGILLHVIQMRFVEYPELSSNASHQEYMVKISDDLGLHTLAKRLDVKLHPGEAGQMIAIAKDFGTADLLVVRDTFKSPLMIVLYTILVLAACFHGFNGLSTFMITWGVTISDRSQLYMNYLSMFLMVVFASLGLAAVWLTYWVNLFN